jgi:RNA polymerase sigma factor (sigma-70 family)
VLTNAGEQGTRMTREEYGSAYQQGLNMTVRFLMSRGLTYDTASEIGQAAWVRGWERLEQLRDASTVLSWMNSIALNLHRANVRREPLLQRLPNLPVQPKINLAAIDTRRILEVCKKNDRMVLQRYYLDEFKIQDIARQQGCTETAVRIRLVRARRAASQRAVRSTRSAPGPQSVNFNGSGVLLTA